MLQIFCSIIYPILSHACKTQVTAYIWRKLTWYYILHNTAPKPTLGHAVFLIHNQIISIKNICLWKTDNCIWSVCGKLNEFFVPIPLGSLWKFNEIK